MARTLAYSNTWTGRPAIVGGFLMLLDSLWGLVAVLPFGWDRPDEISLGVSLLVGLPAYLADARLRSRIVVFLPALLLFRIRCESAQGEPPTLGTFWRGSVLLIAATLLLQWSKRRTSPATRAAALRGQP